MVSIASPLNLLRELFTVRGAGTLIRLGSSIDHYTSYDSLDRGALRSLLEESFSKRLGPELLRRTPLKIYLERDYRAVAILEEAPVAPFLTKFAVSRVARGEGVARDLWDAMIRDHPSMYWRARPDNPVESWYLTLCDGMLRLPEWHVYWKNLDPGSVEDAVHTAISRAPDFEAV